MYYYKKAQATSLEVNQSYEGEPIEAKVRRIMLNKEPITDGAPLIYTDRSKGVEPAYNIRTDRFDLAIDATDAITRSHIGKREQRQKLGEQAKEGMKKEGNIGGTESTQTTT